MTSNKQNTPELEEGDLFTAVLPSREKLLKMFRNEVDDICIKDFIRELSDQNAVDYCIATYTSGKAVYWDSWIRREVLEGDTFLLCRQLTREGTASFGRSLILAILHSDVIKDIEDVTDYFGYGIPLIYNGFLTNITRVSFGIIV